MNRLQINLLISKIFKILPLKEQGNPKLPEYIDSVSIQLKGALETCMDLADNVQYNRKYIEVLNTINYLKHNDFSVKQCKREIFKCLSILDSIRENL